MKKIISLFCVMVLLVTTLCVGTMATADALGRADVIALYKDQLLKHPESIIYSSGYAEDTCYTIYDIDKNGVVELIVKQDWDEYYIYTIQNNRCVLVHKELFWNYADCLYKYNGNGLIVHAGGMGMYHMEQVYLYTMKNGALTQTTLVEVVMAQDSSGYDILHAELDKYQPLDIHTKARDFSLLETIGTYKVTYNANGGSGAPAAQTKVEGTALKLSTKMPTRSGYAFVGWSTSKIASTAAYQPGSQFKNNANTTLYAVWKKGAYRVTFSGNGGSGVPNAQFKIPGTPLTLSTQVPTRSGYAFVGWSTSASATTAAYQPGSQFKNNSNTTLYAVWQKGAYRVAFSGNGGSGVPNAQIKVPGTPLKLSTQVPTRSGYAFVGWSTSASATTAAYQPGSQFKNNSNTTLYAVWQKDAYRVAFSGNGGSGVPNAQIKIPGTPLKLATQVPTRSGYAFVGWATSPTATKVAYHPGSQFKNNTNTTLYAVWQKGAYRVTFSGNGGSGVPNAQIKVPGTPLTLPTKKPTRAGYKFLGWSTNPNAKAGTYASGGQFKINAHTTLYAVWKRV